MQTGTTTRHVMFVISGLERGGAEYQLVATAAGLSERGWNVTVLSFLPFSPTSWSSELQGTGVRLLTLNASSGMLKYMGLLGAVRAVRRLKPDVLVGFMFHGIMTARIAGRLTGVPAIVSSVRNERDGPLRERVMRATNGLTGAVTVLSQHLATEIVQRRIAAGSHVHVIPNSVEVARFAMRLYGDRTRELLRVGHDQFLWLAAGRLDKQKDYPNLLNAFSALSKSHPNTRLMIAGDGPLRSELESLIQQLAIEERVTLLGLRQDMPALYAASDALVLSSAWEGMPNVALEAMASMKPIVATSVGAVPELIADGVSGLIVPPHDHEALAAAMERMMNFPEATRQALGHAGYERVRTEFSRDAVIDKWERLFNKLLAARS